MIGAPGVHVYKIHQHIVTIVLALLWSAYNNIDFQMGTFSDQGHKIQVIHPQLCHFHTNIVLFLHILALH